MIKTTCRLYKSVLPPGRQAMPAMPTSTSRARMASSSPAWRLDPYFSHFSHPQMVISKCPTLRLPALPQKIHYYPSMAFAKRCKTCNVQFLILNHFQSWRLVLSVNWRSHSQLSSSKSSVNSSYKHHPEKIYMSLMAIWFNHSLSSKIIMCTSLKSSVITIWMYLMHHLYIVHHWHHHSSLIIIHHACIIDTMFISWIIMCTSPSWSFIII